MESLRIRTSDRAPPYRRYQTVWRELQPWIGLHEQLSRVIILFTFFLFRYAASQICNLQDRSWLLRGVKNTFKLCRNGTNARRLTTNGWTTNSSKLVSIFHHLQAMCWLTDWRYNTSRSNCSPRSRKSCRIRLLTERPRTALYTQRWQRAAEERSRGSFALKRNAAGANQSCRGRAGEAAGKD